MKEKKEKAWIYIFNLLVAFIGFGVMISITFNEVIGLTLVIVGSITMILTITRYVSKNNRRKKWNLN